MFKKKMLTNYFLLHVAVFAPPEHRQVPRRLHQESGRPQRERPAVAGDGVLRRRLDHRPGEVVEGRLPARGLDRLHLPRDPARPRPPPRQARHPPRHQGPERAAHRPGRGEARRLRRLGAARQDRRPPQHLHRHALLDGARGDRLRREPQRHL